MSNSSNSGTVFSSAVATASYCGVGGLVGRLWSDRITDSHNSGVKGQQDLPVGGQ